MTCEELDGRRLSQLVAPAFHEVHRGIRKGKVQELVLKGGRGSAKSSYAALEFWVQLLQRPDCHGAALRRVGKTLRNSVWAQLLWAAGQLGIEEDLSANVSQMELCYLPTGQKVFCFGLDDETKLKSIRPVFGHIGIVWFEELDQFEGLEQVRSAEQSLLRGQGFTLSIKCFNPPREGWHWVNRYALEQKPGKLVHHSDYRGVPQSWLGSRFLEDAEHLRRTNPTAYQHEYLGQAVGTGTQVFDNLRMEVISDQQIGGFERWLHGVDWGWYPDPWAFNSCSYDRARRTLYIWDEDTRRKTSNQDTAQLLLERGIGQDGDREESLIADSAEEKSCRDYRAMGLPCRGAEKGPGSVRAGMKWLQSLDAIVIDPARCPVTAREFQEYAYEKDRKTGEVLQGYPDRDNHHIDAVRYATSRIWKRRGE